MQIRRLARSSFRRIAPWSFALAGLTVAMGVAAAGAFEGDSLGMSSTNPMARVIPSPQVRWHSSMAAFAASDLERAPVTEGVLFVGSSTIRMWSHLAQDFRQLPVLNRGFGGSTMADVQYFAPQLVLKYKPRQVLVYAGDNDLAEGRSPQQVVESFRAFVDQVRRELPETRISYISIKPSPSRAGLLPKIREANGLLAAYVHSLPNAAFIDIFTPMLDTAGAPRMDLFGPDRLHMNDAGYALWTSIVSAYVTPTPGATMPAHALPVEVTAPVQSVQQIQQGVATPAAGVAGGGTKPSLNVMRAVYRQ
ncbi:GDSL family lipase [Xylophilus sp. Kf1]|nr:GDSL family lipase [Xylophilus sp. Kf1]